MTSILCRACFARVLAINIHRRQVGSQNSANDNSPLKRLLDDASSFGEATTTEPELQWATQPYATQPQQQTEPERVEPQETTILLFPGQGSQRVGMGHRLHNVPAARDLYELASSTVGWNVAKLCEEGPEEELERKSQTAVLVTSLAALELVRDTRPSALERVRAVAGFSLGEITALVFAGALQLEPALRLVELRAAAMRAAAAERAGGMLTVWLAADANLPHAMLRAREHAAERGVPYPVCQIANYLYPHCKVVAGDEQALKFIESRGSEFGVRRCARVRVSGAYHTPLMGRAGEALRLALRECEYEVRAPRVRVVSAVDARAYGSPLHVRRQLVRHVVSPVRWEQALQRLYARPPAARFPLTLALGPGGALRSTLRQVNAKAWDSSLQIDV